MAFNEADGKFLYQIVSDKLASGRVNDWPFQGIASSPLVEGEVAYYVNNRAEVVCFKVKDGSTVWKFDTMEELGNHPHNLANCSPVAHGDLLFISTSNGQDESHVNIPSPKCPPICALNKKTGELVWEENSVGDKILHGQWSPPAVGTIGGVVQLVNGQGDGWVRGYEAATGKKLWEFDTNPKNSVWPKTRNEIISTPIIYGDRVYLANGQDPEHGEGEGHLYCIDATKRGDITESGRVWHFDKIRRSISTGALHNGVLYYSDFSGFLHALNPDTGEPYWKYDMLAAVWGSPVVIEDRVYLGDEDGDVVVLEAGKKMKQIAEMNMGSSVYCSPVPANGTLYVVNRNQLFAIAKG
jgi:outer membrane protein assembly factor BamB